MQPGCISLIAVFENLISPWAAFEPSLFCPPRKPAFNNSFLSFSFEHGDVGRVFFFFLIHFEPGPTQWLYSVSGLSLIGSCISKWTSYSSRGCLFCLTVSWGNPGRSLRACLFLALGMQARWSIKCPCFMHLGWQASHNA